MNEKKLKKISEYYGTRIPFKSLFVNGKINLDALHKVKEGDLITEWPNSKGYNPIDSAEVYDVGDDDISVVIVTGGVEGGKDLLSNWADSNESVRLLSELKRICESEYKTISFEELWNKDDDLPNWDVINSLLIGDTITGWPCMSGEYVDAVVDDLITDVDLTVTVANGDTENKDGLSTSEVSNGTTEKLSDFFGQPDSEDNEKEVDVEV